MIFVRTGMCVYVHSCVLMCMHVRARKNSLCHSPQWNHSQKISLQTGTGTQNLVAKGEHQSKQLQNGAKKKKKKTREPVHLVKKCKTVCTYCASKVLVLQKS